MTRPSAWPTLSRLSEKSALNCLQLIAQARLQLNRHERQRDSLALARKDYLSAIPAQLEIQTWAIDNTHRFCSQINFAIQGLDREIDRLHHRIASLQAQYLSHKSKQQAFDKLQDIQRAQTLQRQDRLEAQSLDEIASLYHSSRTPPA